MRRSVLAHRGRTTLRVLLAGGAALWALSLWGAFAGRTVAEPHEALVVRYEARDQLTSWVGEARVAELDLEIDLVDLRRSRLRAVVHPADFDSGGGLRDLMARRSVFLTDRYPEAVFELTRVTGAAIDLPDGSERSLAAFGTLEIRGVAREVEIAVTLARQADVVAVTAAWRVSLEAFGVPAPRFLTLVAEDRVEVEVEGRVRLLPATTAATRRGGTPAPPPRARRPPA
jgi:polyisoprenoid-binding protein YceI